MWSYTKLLTWSLLKGNLKTDKKQDNKNRDGGEALQLSSMCSHTKDNVY